MDGHTVSPFDLSLTLPVGGGLLVPVFLIRLSCHKTTHANGYYGAWPGWAVPISVLPLTLAVQGTLKESSATPQFKSINFSALNFLYSLTLIIIRDYWKNHSFD